MNCYNLVLWKESAATILNVGEVGHHESALNLNCWIARGTQFLTVIAPCDHGKMQSYLMSEAKE